MKKETQEKYLNYMLEQTKQVLSIDSPTGYTKEAADYILNEFKNLGYEPSLTVKGGVLVSLGGQDKEDAILLRRIQTLSVPW